MTKHRQVFLEMLEQNKELFEEFRRIHDRYALHPAPHQKEFNEKGEEVQAVIRQYENRLCRSSENSGFGKFTTNLADKFHEEIRVEFPEIDNIGLITKTFDLKRIKLD